MNWKKLHIILIVSAISLTFNGCYSTMLTQENQTAAATDRETIVAMPQIAKAKLFQHAMPEVYKLDNGMDVLYVHNPMIPLMNMKVVFNSGGSADPKDKSGLSSFTATMLKEGANGKSAQELSDAVERIGATLGPGMTQDTGSIYIESLTQYFGAAVDILSDVWLKPDFTQESFERLQKIVVMRLQQRADSPTAVAKLASDTAYFGMENPYGRSVDGYVDTVSRMTVEDIKARYADLFHPSRAAIVGVGDMEPSKFVALMNDKFGKLDREKDAPKVVDLGFEKVEAKRRLVVVDKPNAPQTVIRIYEPAVSSTSMETLTWQFVNIPFGGSFTSRLMQNIREDKGYSYGASSGVVSMLHDGVFVSTSSVESGVTGAALGEFMAELSRLPKGDFDEDEFARARETWKAELVQSFETQAGVLATIAGLYVNDKPMTAINDFARELETYDLAKFNAIAREFPTIDEATIVLVGDRSTILSQIAGMDLPEPEFYDTQGHRVVN